MKRCQVHGQDTASHFYYCLRDHGCRLQNSATRTEDGADNAIEGQVAGVLHLVGHVRAGRPELCPSLPGPAARRAPAQRAMHESGFGAGRDMASSTD